MAATGQAARAPKREVTRMHIMKTYVSLMDEMPFDKISVSRLCSEVGIVRSTFYTYYDDIYAVVQDIEDWVLSRLNAVDAETRHWYASRPERTPDGAPMTEWGFSLLPPHGFREWFDVCEESRDVLQRMLGPNGDPYFAERLRRQLAEHANLLMDFDHMPQDQMRRGFVESLVGIHFLLLRNWVTHEQTSLSKESILMILNSMRVGGNVMGHYQALEVKTTARGDGGRDTGCW